MVLLALSCCHILFFLDKDWPKEVIQLEEAKTEDRKKEENERRTQTEERNKEKRGMKKITQGNSEEFQNLERMRSNFKNRRAKYKILKT